MSSDAARIDNAQINEREMRQGKTVLVSKPRIASLGLTLRCNLNCIMCFTQKMEKKDMDDDIFNNVIQLFPYLEEVRWNDAGEFFASKKCEKYLETINQVRIPKSYLSTNLKAADRYMEQIVGGGFTHLSVSIDAATADTYHNIRRGGRFDELCSNLAKIRDLKEKNKSEYPHLTFVFVAMKRNIGELTQFVELAHRYGAEEIHVLKLLPNPAEIEKTESISIEELRPFYQKAYDKAQQHGIRLSHIAFTDRELGVETQQSGDRSSGTDDPAFPDRNSQFQFEGLPFCHSPWTEILIDVDGKVRPCCYHPKIMGDLHDDSVLDIWNNKEYQSFRQNILNHDFIECHSCSWLSKVFHYQVPAWSKYSHPLNQRFEALTRGWDLSRDIYNPLNPFTELKVELDPMAFRLNKEWDLGGVLPTAIGSSEVDEYLENISKRADEWIQDNFDQDLVTQDRPFPGIVKYVKKLLVRLMRFHTGSRFLRQKETNIIMLEQLKIMAKEHQRRGEYLDLVKTFIDNQKNFNALLVQYINLFSDRFFERIERQKNINKETLQIVRETNDRIDHLEQDNHLLLEMLSKMTSEMFAKKPDPQNVLTALEHVFFRGELAAKGLGNSISINAIKKCQVTILNKSMRRWESKGLYKVGLSYKWFDDSGLEIHVENNSIFWLEKILLPGDSAQLSFPITAPARKGKHTLLISLVSSDNRWFFDYNTGFVQLQLEVLP